MSDPQMKTLTLTVTGPDGAALADQLAEVAALLRVGVTASRVGAFDWKVADAGDVHATVAVASSMEEEGARAALRQICELVRQLHPGAHTVVLDDSEQGDWGYLDHAQDEAGATLDVDDVYDEVYDLAGCIPTWSASAVLDPHLLPDTHRTKHNPMRCVVLIDSVLAGPQGA